jgi:hypothetical protein
VSEELCTWCVAELPYPVTDTSKLPGPAAYRRLGVFEDQWLVPACRALGLELVAIKTANGSLQAYLYGGVDPAAALVARLAPFDCDLGFYDDDDPAWGSTPPCGSLSWKLRQCVTKLALR